MMRKRTAPVPAADSRQSHYGRIMKLTVPVIIQNLLSTAVSSADVVMLNYVGQAHISAVSLAAQYANILFMILYGIGTGVTMLCAQYYGKKDMRAIHLVEGIALRFSLICAGLFAAGAMFFPRAMMRVFTPDAELIEIGGQYLRCIGAAYLCWGVIEIYLSALRSVGRVAVASALNVFAFVLNILLNAVFIFGLFGAPKLGAMGVAIATSVSRALELDGAARRFERRLLGAGVFHVFRGHRPVPGHGHDRGQFLRHADAELRHDPVLQRGRRGQHPAGAAHR